MRSLVVAILFAVICSSVVCAETITSAQSGNWEDANTWVGGVVPAAGDDVVIASPHTVGGSPAGAAHDVTVNAGATLSPLSQLTVTGTLTVNGTFVPVGATLNNLVVGAGGSINLNGSFFLIGGNLTSANPAPFVAPVSSNSVQFIGTTTIANKIDIPYMIVNGGATVTGAVRSKSAKIGRASRRERG